MFTKLETYFTKVTRQRTYLLLTLLVVGFLGLRLPFIGGKGYGFDESCWMTWGYKAYTFGISGVYKLIPSSSLYNTYNNFTIPNYPPGLIYLLQGLTYIIHLLHLPLYNMPVFIPAYKILALFIDTLTVWAVYKISRRHLTLNQSLIITSLYALNPYIAYDSVFWGQTDNLLAFSIVFVLYFLDNDRLLLAYLFMAIGILLKMQFIVFIPIFLIYATARYGFKKQFWPLLSGIGLILLAFSPFILTNNTYSMLENGYLGAVGYYQCLTSGAQNIWALGPFIGLQWSSNDTTRLVFNLSGRTIGLILFSVFYLISVGYVLLTAQKEKIKSLAIGGSFSYFAFFMLNTEMHERYLFPFFILFLITLIWSPIKSRLLYILLSFTQLLSLMFELNPSKSYGDFIRPVATQTMYFLAAVNLLSFILVFYWVLQEIFKNKAPALKIVRSFKNFIHKEINISSSFSK